MAFNFNQWYLKKTNGDVIYKYAGPISSDSITETFVEVENSLKTIKIKKHKIRIIYNVLIECLQNLYHHADVPPISVSDKNNSKFGVLIFAEDHSFFRISTGNFIKKENLSRIENLIQKTNSLSDDDIVVVYREILNFGESTSKSTGLGLLDMVRKTGNKLEYFIYTHDDKYSFLSLDVYIS